MINNFKQIAKHLHWDSEAEFYMIQIIQRKKDNESMTWNNRVIKDYYVFSMDDFIGKTDEITKLCKVFNARAYIRLSRRKTEHMAKKMIIELWEAFGNNSFNHLKNIYATVVGRDVGMDKIWIVDLDWDAEYLNNMFWKVIHSINMCKPNPWQGKLIDIIKTNWWVHLITKPFDLNAFNAEYKDINIHKNNPTLLYCPNIKK